MDTHETLKTRFYIGCPAYWHQINRTLLVIFNLYELQFAATFQQKLAGSSLRMDLIILVPILYVLTLAAMLSLRTQLKTKSTNA